MTVWQQQLMMVRPLKLAYKAINMIRYVEEHETNLDSVHSEPSFTHRPKPPQLTRRYTNCEVPEEINNSSNALRKLKQMNDRKEMLKGRLSFLQIHQQKNQSKALNNSQQYQFHQFMHEQLQRTRQAKAEHLRQVLRKVEESHLQATKHRRQHRRNLSDAQKAIRSSNQKDYSKAKQHSSRIEKSIEEMKSSDLKRNKQRQTSVRKYEQSQKQHVAEYLEKKHEEIRRRQGEEAGKVSRIQRQKVSQLEQLGRLESMMVERQARSKMSSDESAMRLRKLIGGKGVSTSHTSKLPSVNANHTEPDIVILP